VELQQPTYFDLLPINVLQNIGRHLRLTDLGNFSQINKAVYEANRATLMACDYMVNFGTIDPGTVKTGGSLLANAKAEKLTVKAILDAGIAPLDAVCFWLSAPDSTRAELAKEFEKPGLKPDVIFCGRPLDIFSSNLGDPTKMKEGQVATILARKAQEAMQSQIPKDADEKWRHYGPRTIAVANVSQFPLSISSDEIARTLLGTVTPKRKAPTQEFWFVRDMEVRRIIV
jgi:hypothetical protein